MEEGVVAGEIVVGSVGKGDGEGPFGEDADQELFRQGQVDGGSGGNGGVERHGTEGDAVDRPMDGGAGGGQDALVLNGENGMPCGGTHGRGVEGHREEVDVHHGDRAQAFEQA